MVSDQGPQFTSRFWKVFGLLIGSSISMSSGFHPQSNDQTERVNQDIEKTLSCLVTDNNPLGPLNSFGLNSLITLCTTLL